MSFLCIVFFFCLFFGFTRVCHHSVLCFMAPIYTKLTADYPEGIYPHGHWSYLESVYFATISYSSVG